MKKIGSVSLIVSLIVGIFILLLILAEIPQVASAKEAVVRSTIKDRTSLSLTIYNQNFALVREERNLTLPSKGEQEVLFEDMPVQIEPDTVFLETKGRDSQILEQKFEYNVVTHERLLQNYVGHAVKILEINPKTGEKNLLEAELMSYQNNQPIYRIGGEIYLGYPGGTVIVPRIPEQLVSHPTLRWMLKNPDGGNASEMPVTVSYLTRGVNWRADYILQLPSNGDQGDLMSWITIENQSGSLFENAALKLVAGEVHRKEEFAPAVRRMKAEAFADAEATFQEGPFSEYHLYTLERKSTLKDQQATQIPFIKASHVPIQKEFVFPVEGSYYNRRQTEFFDIPKPAKVYLKMENRKEQNLGLPLPQGKIKVYQRGKDGSLEFIGEDRIGHTPVDEAILVQIGNAFDVVGIQKQMDWEKISAQVYESGWQVTLRNRKEEKIPLRVVVPVGGEWKIMSSSHPHKRLDAGRVEFTVPLPAKGEEVLTYRLQVKY